MIVHKCDGCGREAKDSDDPWFELGIINNMGALRPPRHACSVACLLRWLREYSEKATEKAVIEVFPRD